MAKPLFGTDRIMAGTSGTDKRESHNNAGSRRPAHASIVGDWHSLRRHNPQFFGRIV
jgi:hypothetical protein